MLTLERIERQQAGVYQCTADNGVGEPVNVDMRLDVLCKYSRRRKPISFTHFLHLQSYFTFCRLAGWVVDCVNTVKHHPF